MDHGDMGGGNAYAWCIGLCLGHTSSKPDVWLSFHHYPFSVYPPFLFCGLGNNDFPPEHQKLGCWSQFLVDIIREKHCPAFLQLSTSTVYAPSSPRQGICQAMEGCHSELPLHLTVNRTRQSLINNQPPRASTPDSFNENGKTEETHISFKLQVKQSTAIAYPKESHTK